MFIVGYNQRVRTLGLVSVVCVGAGGGNINYGGGEGILGRSQQIIETHFTLNLLPPATARCSHQPRPTQNNIVFAVGIYIILAVCILLYYNKSI